MIQQAPSPSWFTIPGQASCRFIGIPAIGAIAAGVAAGTTTTAGVAAGVGTTAAGISSSPSGPWRFMCIPSIPAIPPWASAAGVGDGAGMSIPGIEPWSICLRLMVKQGPSPSCATMPGPLRG